MVAKSANLVMIGVLVLAGIGIGLLGPSLTGHVIGGVNRGSLNLDSSAVSSFRLSPGSEINVENVLIRLDAVTGASPRNPARCNLTLSSSDGRTVVRRSIGAYSTVARIEEFGNFYLQVDKLVTGRGATCEVSAFRPYGSLLSARFAIGDELPIGTSGSTLLLNTIDTSTRIPTCTWELTDARGNSVYRVREEASSAIRLNELGGQPYVQVDGVSRNSCELSAYSAESVIQSPN